MVHAHFLDVDPAIDMLGNLLLAGVYVTQSFAPSQTLRITLPSKVFNTVAKHEFNRCFSDVLLDYGFRDEELELIVLPEDSFKFEVV